jgi:anti-sigma factor RsiW
MFVGSDEMKETCGNWNDSLQEAALTGAMAKGLEEHLRNCAKCAAELDELRARAARLDALLPLVTQGAEPSADFRARVLAAAEAGSEGKRARQWRLWTLAGATAAIVMLVIGAAIFRKTTQTIPEEEVVAAQKLAEWRAPSDSLLVTPGQEILKTTPKLGQSYLNVPVKTEE